MKFVEAALTGLETLPHIREDYFRYDDDGEVIGACLLGAAYYVLTGETQADNFTIIQRLLGAFPELENIVWHPLKGVPSNASAAIADLNDNTSLSPEQILAWFTSTHKLPARVEVTRTETEESPL